MLHDCSTRIQKQSVLYAAAISTPMNVAALKNHAQPLLRSQVMRVYRIRGGSHSPEEAPGEEGAFIGRVGVAEVKRHEADLREYQDVCHDDALMIPGGVVDARPTYRH